MKILLTSDIHRGISSTTHVIHRKWASEISKLEWDILVCAGDIGTAKYQHFKSGIKFLRKTAGDRPVLVVLGNHDMWDKSYKNCGFLLEKARQDMANLNITYLPDSPFKIDDVLIVGWNGWYRGYHPPDTNDVNFMPSNGHVWAKELEKSQLLGVVETLDKETDNCRSVIAVTHMAINEGVGGWRKDNPEWHASASHFEIIKDKIDHLLFGHSHHRIEGRDIEGVKLWNSGSDYNRPKHIIIEV